MGNSVTHDQLAGLLSGLVGISVLVAGFFQWWGITYNGKMILNRWVKLLFVGLIAAQTAALVALFV
jgi:hypothetical protein